MAYIWTERPERVTYTYIYVWRIDEVTEEWTKLREMRSSHGSIIERLISVRPIGSFRSRGFKTKETKIRENRTNELQAYVHILLCTCTRSIYKGVETVKLPVEFSLSRSLENDVVNHSIAGKVLVVAHCVRRTVALFYLQFKGFLSLV